MSMQKLSQRDPKWGSKLLGFSKTSTLHSYGCTITSLSMLAGLTPDETNNRLKAVGGFLVDLIIWSKIEEAIPWLKFEWRGYKYDNDKVKAAIKRNGGCLVEVDWDGSSNTKGIHWVLYIGNQRMIDPWTGREGSTSKYPLRTGYAIINKIKPMPENNDLQECLKQHKDLIDQLKAEKSRHEETKSELAGEKESTKSLKKQLSDSEYKNEQLIMQIAGKLSCEHTLEAILKELEKWVTKEDQWAQKESEYIKKQKEFEEESKVGLEALEGEIKQLKADNDQLQSRIEHLEQRIEGLKDTKQAKRGIFEWLKDFLQLKKGHYDKKK